MAGEGEYGLSRQITGSEIPAPDLDWRPTLPVGMRPAIGVIGAGGIAEYHLKAYRRLNLPVVAIANRTLHKVERLRDLYSPDAVVSRDYLDVIRDERIQVVDVLLPPGPRIEVIEAAIRAGKHVLSQKPFVLDLDDADRLISLAEQNRVRLAVNQNGRWAPHFSYIRQAVARGLLGTVATVNFQLNFDHSWTVGTAFEAIPHLILYDFGIHWFDIAACVTPVDSIESVFASVSRASHQKARPPFLASVVLSGPQVQVGMTFNAATQFGQCDRTVVCGSLGTIESNGPSLSSQTLTLTTSFGRCQPQLEGTWFESGFEGAMVELLTAIAENREPAHSAANNQRSLQLCFAALESVRRGCPVSPSEVRRYPSS